MASSSGGNTATFTYNDEQIFTIEITNNQPKDGTELVGWLIAYLKVSKYNDVREIIESHTINNCTRLYRYNTDMIRPLHAYPNSRSSRSKAYEPKQS